MCGIAGELRRGAPPDRDALARMSAALAPRGPDGDGIWVDGDRGLAHRRLAIIDLSERGAQPMVDEALGLTIVFNGIIYNHRELRAELERAGYAFRSDADTEVLLKGWAEWGERMLDRLAGMFAFCLVEHGVGPRGARARPARQEAAVPAGAAGTAGCAWPRRCRRWWRRAASTRRSTRSRCTTTSPSTRSCRRRGRSCAACRSSRRRRVLVIEPDGRRRERRYWDPPFARDPARADWSAEDWEAAVLDALRLAVRRRMVSDVPVGILLSGGLDSSLIVALLAEQGQRGLATFSVGFRDVGERVGDEFEFSDLVAAEFGTDHHQIRVEPERLLPALPRAIAAMSEPMVSHDAVAFFLLSEEVAKVRKVVQSGQGADEVFAGYYWYPPLLEADGDGLGVYADAFFDRDDAGVAALVGERHAASGDPSRRFAATWFARPGRGERDRPRAADRRRGDARRRPGQARRQHDDGARAGGAHAVPRPRARRARGRVPARAQAGRGRQGRLEARRARDRARRGDRPAEGLLPRARAVAPRGAGARARGRRAALAGGASTGGCSAARWSRRCWRRRTSTARTSTARRCGSSACSSCGCRRTWADAALAGGDRRDPAREGADRPARLLPGAGADRARADPAHAVAVPDPVASGASTATSSGR